MKTTACMMVALVAGALSAMERIDLNGLWDFRFEKGKSLEEVATSSTFTANDKMVVPGCWNAMSRWFNQHGTGLYRTRFALKDASPNAFLVVDGCGLRSKYWIDGREVGFSKLPWSKFEFATGALAAGEHELVAAVDSLVDNTKVKLFWDFYDFYPFGGFHHGVWLDVQTRPTELRRVVVRTRDYRTGTVELEAQFAGSEAPKDFTAEVAFDGGAAQAVAFKSGRAFLVVPNFKLWSPGRRTSTRSRSQPLNISTPRPVSAFARLAPPTDGSPSTGSPSTSRASTATSPTTSSA